MTEPRPERELVAFDDYAHLHQHETLPFRRARSGETDQPGHLGDHLRKLRHQMLGGGRSNVRHLRAVASDDP